MLIGMFMVNEQNVDNKDGQAISFSFCDRDNAFMLRSTFMAKALSHFSFRRKTMPMGLKLRVYLLPVPFK